MHTRTHAHTHAHTNTHTHMDNHVSIPNGQVCDVCVQKPQPPVEFESVSPDLLLPPYKPGPNQLKSFVQVGWQGLCVCACA